MPTITDAGSNRRLDDLMREDHERAALGGGDDGITTQGGRDSASHTLYDKTNAAYQRGDQFKKRRVFGANGPPSARNHANRRPAGNVVAFGVTRRTHCSSSDAA
jgi:hypothetical protein